MSQKIADLMMLETLKENLEINHPEMVMQIKEFLFNEFLKDNLNPCGSINEKIKNLLISFYLK